MFFRDNNAVTPIKTIAVRRDPFGEYTIRLGYDVQGSFRWQLVGVNTGAL